MKNDSILRGHTTMETAFEVKDYPYGFKLRTSIFYWIETRIGKGDRMGAYTINPKTGRANAPKYTTYSTFAYLYFNDNGHVIMGVMDSYNIEDFINRFEFITERYGIEYMNADQQANIRHNHFAHVRANAPYIAVKYSEENKPRYIQWVKDTLKHIATCEFKDLCNYPAPPEQDNPEGQVKMVTTEYVVLG